MALTISGRLLGCENIDVAVGLKRLGRNECAILSAMDDSLGVNPPAKKAAGEERRRKEKLISQLLHLENEDLFTGALRQFGLEENSSEWNLAVSAWREKQKKLR